MPLRAKVNGKELISHLLPKEQWDELRKQKKKEVLLPCGCGGHLRTSKLGLQHFYHQRKNPDCDWENEGPVHLQAKIEILKACESLGFSTEIEALGKDWRADVLATKQGSRNNLIQIAFEVQWSSQTLQVTEERQAKYDRDHIRTCWLFQRLPSEKQRKDLPMFLLRMEPENRLVVEVDGQSMPLVELGVNRATINGVV
jgi:competence CoiA-like predicted nuclease